ncbi:hypothetical protein [Natrialba sp. INN-245]|uniref:hypothetical protein n=1 Tax=Natrialba sp. INN-245 TaxID=2690967 RepID=UPI001F244999|nr:hypothetical protein [Natrialba sp. INN-245]
MVETTEAKQVCRAASTVVYPALDFGIKSCGSYTREDFEKLLSRVAFEQEFANIAGKTCQLDDGEPVDITSTARNGLAKSLLYHLRNLEADAIDGQFDGVRDDLFEILRKQRLLPECVDVAIDLHEWRFYGDADTDHVLLTYPDQGTNRTYCFATICIVAPGMRFTLDVLALEANGFREKAEPFARCSKPHKSTSRSDTSSSIEGSTRFTSLRNSNSTTSTISSVHVRAKG